MTHTGFVRRACLPVMLATGIGLNLGTAPAPRTQTLMTSGAPAPAGLKFTSFGRAATNARGTVCFLAGWDGVLHRREGLYLRRGNEVLPIARAGDLIPGGEGARFSFPPEFADEFTSFSLNNRDEVAFIVRQGLFIYSDGAIHALARVGAEVPDAGDLRWDEIYAVSLNNAGVVAFSAGTHSSGDGERYEGVFVADGEKPKLVLFVGDPVPDADAEINSFGGVALNDEGQIATLSRLGEDDLAAVLLTTGSETQLLALQGQPAPEGTWTDLGSVALNDRGDVVFQGRFETSDGEHTGIYLDSGGVVTIVASPGQPLEAANGASLGEFLARPVLDDEGNIAFVAGLPGSDRAQVLVVASGGRRTVLAMAGEPIRAGSPGTIASFAGLNLGSLRSGQVAVSLTASDGQGGDAVVRFEAGKAPDIVVDGGTPLPPDGALATVDGESEPGETQAQITRGGAVVFAAEVGGYGRALFRLAAQGPEMITRLGVSGTEEPPLRSIVSFDVNRQGQIAFLGHRDDSGEDAAVYVTSLDRQATPSVVARIGALIPGAGGQLITRLGRPQIDAQGQVIFAASGASPDQPIDSASTSYLLRWKDGSLTVLAVEGQKVDGAGALAGQPAGGLDAGLPGDFRELQVNERGEALFINSYLDSAGVFVPAGLFLLDSSGIRPVALYGQKAPLVGAPSYSAFSSLRLSANGTVAFVATLVGGGRKPRSGLFRVRGGETAALAVAGEPAPGLSGAQYRAIAAPVLNETGEAAFLALLQGPDAVKGMGAVFMSVGTEVQPALAPSTDGDASEELHLRLDDRAPAAPMALLDDDSLLMAARGPGDAAPAGLFLVRPN